MTRALFRGSGTFSLEEAATIRRAIAEGGVVECPGCHVPISHLVGDNGQEDVWLLQCQACGRGLVLRDIPGHSGALAGRE